MGRLGSLSSLALFVLRVFADYADGAFAFDYSAFFANRFYRWPDFHFDFPFAKEFSYKTR
jgi:hypothetical protein